MSNIPPNWQVVLRSASGDVTTVSERPARKYLWVRRTSRRAYNLHMSRIRDSVTESALPAVLIFSALIGVAVGLSIFMP